MQGRANGRGQEGSSLVEVLVAIAVLAAVAGTVVAGLFTTARVAGRDRGDALLLGAASNVTAHFESMAYRPCASAQQIEDLVRATAGGGLPSGVTVDVVGVQYWSRSAQTFHGACDTSGGNAVDGGAQLVHVELRSVARAARPASFDVVLRDRTARP